MNLRWRELGPAGKHDSGQPRWRIDQTTVRGFLLTPAVPAAVSGALLQWAAMTWLLGANLAQPVHVVLVTAFLPTVAVLAYVVAWQGYRRLARSQERRTRQREGRP